MNERRPSMESYCSSMSSYMIQDENNESLFIHQLKERPNFNFQIELQEKEQFQAQPQYLNQPHDQKDPFETVQEMLFTEEKLELVGQALKQIPKLQQNFINIKLLNLSQNQLSSIPQLIIKMVNIKKLNLNNNQLTVLPIFLQSLRHLEVLEIADNQLTTYNINPPALKHLNVACNYIEQLYFPNLEHLCIQMNPFTIIPKGFNKILYGMHHIELDWFKYCKPSLPMKINFEKHQNVKDKLIQLLSLRDLDFKTFISSLSLQEPNLTLTDYKDRNLFSLAAINNEIGIIKCLNQIIPEHINKPDFDQNTPLTTAFVENKLRSVKVLRSLGAKFSIHTILQISQRVELDLLKAMLQCTTKSYENQNQHLINDESIVMYRNIDGNTPLHMLLPNFNKNIQQAGEFANLLLSHGANPNTQNKEGWTPLDIAVRKGQISAVRFAVEYNKSKLSDHSVGRYFNLATYSGPSEWSLVHVAASIGNVEILEYLNEINMDFFQQSKCNRVAKNLAIQSLSMLKYMRKLEKKWLIKNVILENSSIQQAEMNVYQMKNQIEKNMAKKQENMIQKIMDQEDEEHLELSSYNENSLRIASENSVREVIAESAPIFQRKANKEVNQMIIQKQNMDQLNLTDFVDHLPEIQRLLRNQNIDLALQKLKNALLSDMLPLVERLKYKNMFQILRYKFRNNSKIELKSQLAQGIQLQLNEYQFKKICREQKSHYLKVIGNFIKEQIKHEDNKIVTIYNKIHQLCRHKNLHTDLLVIDLAQIADMRNRLSNNLIYDLTNYAELLPIQQDQINYWIVSNFNSNKFYLSANITNILNFEYLQRIRFTKRKYRTAKDEDYDNIEQDMIELESSISHYQQFTQLFTPFQKQ